MRSAGLRACALAALAAVGCGPEAPRQGSLPTQPSRTPLFTRVTAESGIRFRHQDGSSGRKWFAEVMGAGCAFADFTGDGRPDIYLLNGAPLPGASVGTEFGNRFYRNEGPVVEGGPHIFTDVTDSTGLRDGGYAMGCCAGDYDNDGDLDLYVTHVGRNTLYRNEGNGTFRDVTARTGVGAGGFSSSAAFGDYDNDGDLDLFVCRYVDWRPETNVDCYAADGQQRVLVYCRPIVYPARPSLLYRNSGNGTFTDVTAEAGLAVAPGRALGAVWTDVEDDGDLDLYVGNDMSANHLFINLGDGRFREEGLRRGVALSATGRPQASMGVASVDYDGDGQLDLACTNFSGEYLALYRNLGGGSFEDASARSGLVEATAPYVGFGLGFPDFNLDGWLDLFVANGHVTEAAERFYPGVSFAQPNLCLLGAQSGRFSVAAAARDGVTTPRVSRGAAFADADADGDVDVLVSNWRDEPDLLRNEMPNRGNWLRIVLRGRRANRMGIGARVEVNSAGRVRVDEVRSGGSYCSQSDLTLTFGLGKASRAEIVRVTWPGGGVDTWNDLASGRTHLLRER